MAKNKKELLEIAASYNLEVADDATKADITALISAYEADNAPEDAPKTSEDIQKSAIEAADRAEKAQAAAEVASRDAAAALAQAKEIQKAAQVDAFENRPTYEHKGRSYGFRKSAPASLRIDGKAMSQEEILKDKVLMTELIEGNNFFLEFVKSGK